MSAPESARQIAAQVLTRVDKGAYANIELDKQLRHSQAEPRDKALATELVYGTLRWRGRLDFVIEVVSKRKVSRLDPIVRNILRLTAYQLLFLSHIPAHAAVHEGVALTRANGQERATAFVNAVARRIQSAAAALFTNEPQTPAELATYWSHPIWLVERWLAAYGEEATKAILAVNQEPARVVLRVNTQQISRTDFLARLQSNSIVAAAGHAPEAVLVEGAPAADAIPGFAAGWFTVQDESSQLVAHAVQPQPGQRVIDLCSAPGGKATHLAQLMRDRGEVIALELHPHRARLVEQTAKRLGLGCISVHNGDSRQLDPAWHGTFDCVLLDAPCTGTGVLRRRVDLRWRLQPGDLAALCVTQEQLLAAAAQLVRPGGILVYSTCSIEPEENAQRIESFLARNDSFRRSSLAFLANVSPGLAGVAGQNLDRGELQLLPSQESDGFFIARLQRNG